MKITIVGSMTFYEKYKKIKQELEKQGHKVIIPLSDDHYQEEENIKRKTMEDFNENLEKSNAILVANFNKNSKKNYIGINSIMEIGMAFNRDKKIFILNEIPEDCKEELKAIGCIVLNRDLEKLQ